MPAAGCSGTPASACAAPLPTEGSVADVDTEFDGGTLSAAPESVGLAVPFGPALGAPEPNPLRAWLAAGDIAAPAAVLLAWILLLP